MPGPEPPLRDGAAVRWSRFKIATNVGSGVTCSPPSHVSIPPHIPLTRHRLPSTTRDSPSCLSLIALGQHLEFEPIFEGGCYPSAEAAKSSK